MTCKHMNNITYKYHAVHTQVLLKLNEITKSFVGKRILNKIAKDIIDQSCKCFITGYSLIVIEFQYI